MKFVDNVREKTQALSRIVSINKLSLSEVARAGAFPDDPKDIPLCLRTQITHRSSLARQIITCAKIEPDAVAVIEPDFVTTSDETTYHEVTYSELSDRAIQLAKVLMKYGVTKNSNIAVLARNSSYTMATYAAQGLIGCDLFILNTGASPEQLHDIIIEHNIEALIYDDFFLPKINAANIHDAQSMMYIRQQPVKTRSDALETHGFRHVKVVEFVDTSDVTLPIAPHRGNVVLMSSGTTGTPKAVVRPEPSWPLIDAAALFNALQMERHGTYLLAASMFHVWGWGLLSLATLIRATLIVTPVNNPDENLRIIDKFKPDAVFSSAMWLKQMVESPLVESGDIDVSSVKVIGNAGHALNAKLVEDINRVFGRNKLVSVYGSTEVSSAAIAKLDDFDSDPCTAGRAPMGSKLLIIDPDTGLEVPDGEIGVIHARNSLSFSGYASERDKPKFHNGLINLGDYGVIHPETGLLRVLGRADDMILVGGENLYPSTVTSALLDHADIDQAHCIGVDDDTSFQRIAAYIVVDPHSHITDDDIRDYVSHTVSDAAVPRDIIRCTSLPRNHMGKVVTAELSPDMLSAIKR